MLTNAIGDNAGATSLTVTGNTFIVREEADIDKIAHHYTVCLIRLKAITGGFKVSKLSGLGRALSLLSVAFGGMGRDYPKYILESQGERLVLPVTPDNYSLTNGQDNKVINITQVGEALLFGNPKLRTLSFSGFFPARDYPFTVGDRKSPDACVALLTKWMEAKAPIRVIITDSPINLMMGLMSFPYKKKDPTGDIYFDASFTEYKDLKYSSSRK